NPRWSRWQIPRFNLRTPFFIGHTLAVLIHELIEAVHATPRQLQSVRRWNDDVDVIDPARCHLKHLTRHAVASDVRHQCDRFRWSLLQHLNTHPNAHKVAGKAV